MATGSSEVARIFLVTNIPPAYGTERGLKNCFRQYCGQEGPQIDYSKVKSPDNNTEAALVTVEGLSSEGAHDALQQKMLLGGRTLNVSHVCSELAALQFGDVDSHLSQTMQKIASRMGLHCTIQRKDIRISGPFDLIQQFRMDLRAEIFLTAQCSSYISVTQQPALKKAPHISFEGSTSSSVISKINEIPSEQQNKEEIEQSPFLKQKTMENDTHMVIDNLSPDVLQLLDKIPEGDIPGVQYNPSLGTVTIQGLNKADVEETASKFEAVYETILAPGPKQFQVDIVQLDKETDLSEVLSLLNELNHQYIRCAFVHSEDTQMIKILSNSTEQIEQAKRQLFDQLKPPNPSEGGDNETADGGTAGKGSVQEFSTKLRSGHTITIKKGDVSKESASVLVAMINDRFQVIGEMAAAINSASKGNVLQKVQEHARANSLVNIGDVIVTRGGGALKCKNVYSVVCPDVTDSVRVGDQKAAIGVLVTKVLSEAERQRARTVVMPSFVSAIFDDVEVVGKTLTEALVDYCYHHPTAHKPPVVSSVTIMVGDETAYGCFVKHLTQAKAKDRPPLVVGAGGKGVEGKGAEGKGVEGKGAEGKGVEGDASCPPHAGSQASSHKAADNGHPTGPQASAHKAAEGGHTQGSPTLAHKVAESGRLPGPPVGTQIAAEGGPPTQAHQRSHYRTTSTGGQPSLKADAMPTRPHPLAPPTTAATSVKASAGSPVNNSPIATATNPVITSGPPPRKDHPLYHAPSDTKPNAKTDAGSAVMDENCPVCHGPFTTPMTSKCEHAFCSQCLNRATQDGRPLCPVCKVAMEGMQPPECPLCKDQVFDAVTTVCCHQIFCRECLTKHLKLFNQCPNCKHTFESVKKTQPLPSNNMSFVCLSSALPGYAGCDTIQITYEVANGIDANGQPYLGASRVAYLPDNIEGREILKLLQRAWKEGLIYYVSPKSEVVWTDIPHKINTTGGQLNRGYPDPQFFYNVKQSLASKGIVP